MSQADTSTPPAFALSSEVDLLKRISGTSLTKDRLHVILRAYEPILAEITKLRTLDLQSVHPAVVFEPTAPYRIKR